MTSDRSVMISVMHCSACRYELQGLGVGTCPECGRPFDPGNPGTFASDLFNQQRKPLFVAAALLLVLLAASGLYAWFSVLPGEFILIVLPGVPGLLAFVGGIFLRRTTPSFGVAAIAATPGLIWALLFYSLAAHMYQSLGGWPASIGNGGFSSSLTLHADLAGFWMTGCLLVLLGPWPIGLAMCVGIRRWRGAVIHFGVFAIAFALAVALMLLAPNPFLDWWWD